jgi:hypothetical protein
MKEGLRFTIEESRVMQGEAGKLATRVHGGYKESAESSNKFIYHTIGLAFLDKAIFTTLTATFLSLRTSTETSDGAVTTTIQVFEYPSMLSSNVSRVQIFGVDSKERSWGIIVVTAYLILALPQPEL